MKKTFLSVVLAGLAAFMSAQDFKWQAFYTQTNENVNAIADVWTAPNNQGGLSLAEDDGNHYVYYNHGNTNSRGLYNLDELTADMYEGIDEYRLEFDLALTPGNNQNTTFNLGSPDIQTMGSDWVTPCGDITSLPDRGLGSGSLFSLIQTSGSNNNWSVYSQGPLGTNRYQRDDIHVTLQKDTWYHFSITVTPAEDKEWSANVTAEITDANGEPVLFTVTEIIAEGEEGEEIQSASVTLPYTDEGNGYWFKQFYVLSGRYNSIMKIDNVQVMKKLKADVAFSFNDNILTITSATEGAVIYYRLQDEPDFKVYQGKLALADNRTMYAYTAAEGYENSDTVAFTPDWFKCEAELAISFDEPWLSIDGWKTGSKDVGDLTAAMFCRWDGFDADANVVSTNAGEYHIGESTGLPYGYGNVEGSAFADLSAWSTLALTVTEGTPRLLLNRQGMDNSGDFIEIRSEDSPYVRAVVDSIWYIDLAKIVAEAGYAHLNCIKGANWQNTTIVEAKLYKGEDYGAGMARNVVVRYTLDGTKPTNRSALYTDRIEVTEPCTVKAAAFADYLNPSDVVTYEIKHCDAPVIAFDGETLSISCATDGAVVHYRIDETMDEEAMYSGPVAIAHNFSVTAYAECEGMLASRESMLAIDTFTVAALVLAFEDPWLTISCDTPGAVIHYTLDGTEPTAESPVYEGRVELNESCEVRAFAEKKWFNNSETASLSLEIKRVEISVDEIGEYMAVTVDGMIGEDELQKIVEQNPVYLDLTAVTNAELPNNAFERMSNLAAVKWNEVTKIEALGCMNPNLLFYCTDESIAPSDAANVIVDGKAERVLLRDLTEEEAALTRGNFYCPEPFEAKRISYEHSYGMNTGRGSSEGWETLALPFDVQNVYNKTKGTGVVPFGKYDKTAGAIGSKPFWLYEFDGDAFVPATSISAGKPYIVSMPNNDAYLAEYNIPGKVSFYSEDVTVAKGELQAKGEFVPAMTHVSAAESVYAINKYEAVDGHSEGSVFVSALREVRPFEAYFVSADTRQKVIRISDISGGKADGIEEVAADAEAEATNTDALYNLQGQRVDRSYRGIVITNGRKVVNRR